MKNSSETVAQLSVIATNLELKKDIVDQMSKTLFLIDLPL